MSLTLSKKFSDAPGALNYPLEMEIVNDRMASASRVHQGCVLEIFNEKYLIDLVLIPL